MSIASPHGYGNDGRLAYDMETRTWYGPTDGKVLDQGGAVFNVGSSKFGGKLDGITDDTQAFQRALAAADPTFGIVTWEGTALVNGLALAGHTSVLQGSGDGSILQAKAGIATAVLDLTGYASPANFAAKREFANFRIIGDGTADATLAKAGLRLGPNCFGLVFRNIGISLTGGPPLDMSGTALINDFLCVVLNQPVGANANNVPYLRMVGACNGNRFLGLGLRSVSAVNLEGVGGVIRIVDDGAFFPTLNKFDAAWFEFQHVPTGGTLIWQGGTDNLFEDTEFFDVAKAAGAVGTSYFMMAKPANEVRGMILGSQGGSNIDVGVVIATSGSRVIGLKGASSVSGSNIQLNAGATKNYCELGGYELITDIAPYTDNSGLLTNVLIDAVSAGQWALVAGQLKLGAKVISGGSVPVVTNPLGGTQVTSVTITGNDTAGVVVVTTGTTGVAAQGQIVSVLTYNVAYSGSRPAVALMYAAPTNGAPGSWFPAVIGTGGFDLRNGSALAASQTFSCDYVAIGRP